MIRFRDDYDSLGLGEEEVRDDGVGDVGDDEDHEVLPSEFLMTCQHDAAFLLTA